jgi:hypothetical protein
MAGSTPDTGGSTASSSDGSGSDTSGSGSDASGSDGGTSAVGGANAGGPSVTNLTDGLKQIAKSGPADVKLSSETRDKYLGIVRTFRDSLQIERDKMRHLETLNYAGGLPSAVQTKNMLESDVTGFGGIEEAVDKYLSYLDQFEKTVKKACDRAIQSG